MTQPQVAVVVTSVPDAAVARQLARTLLDERLLACASLLPGVTSLFRWEGAVQEETEVMMVMKTSSAQVERLLARVGELHPYQVPEVLAFTASAGLPGYCSWVLDETGSER
jgi:periplasmic divalent cation tolerance protein